MFNGVPALSCDQLPQDKASCAALFLAAADSAASTAGYAPSTPGIASDTAASRDSQPVTDAYGLVADRAVAVLTAPQADTSTASSAMDVLSSPRPSARRRLCLCSKLGMLHYAHAEDETPEPVNFSSADADAMDICEDG